MKSGVILYKECAVKYEYTDSVVNNDVVRSDASSHESKLHCLIIRSKNITGRIKSLHNILYRNETATFSTPAVKLLMFKE